MNVLKDLQPKNLFKHFEKISSIPHGSWNEAELSEYILNWAKGLGLWAQVDKLHNVIVKKPASKGYEGAPAVILQAHIDMVCEKNAGIDFDFTKQGLDLYIDEDFIKAKGTTLGADNGIAVAMMMAILEDDTLAHPALEMIFTTVEEAGMDGARAIDASLLNGKKLINLDNSDEGIFITGCAGGAKVTVSLPVQLETLKDDNNLQLYKVFVGGLKGGHSGADIHLERSNSNKLLGHVLSEIKTSYHLLSLTGGSKDNAIPREAEAVVSIKKYEDKNLEEEIKKIEKALKEELKSTEPNFLLKLESVNMALDGETAFFSNDSKEKTIQLLLTLPFGVDEFSKDISGLVETSNNIGTIKLDLGEKSLVITCSIRSSVEDSKKALCERIKTIALGLGAKCHISDGYPGWAYNPVSPLRDICKEVYKKKYGKEPKMMAIHAGLECGIFASKMPDVDIVSFGPDIYDLHTPDERVSISSTARCYDYLLDLLSHLK